MMVLGLAHASEATRSEIVESILNWIFVVARTLDTREAKFGRVITQRARGAATPSHMLNRLPPEGVWAQEADRTPQ
jgi:Ethanolamine utilization protein EutJ (predicted chaperonin)